MALCKPQNKTKKIYLPHGSKTAEGEEGEL